MYARIYFFFLLALPFSSFAMDPDFSDSLRGMTTDDLCQASKIGDYIAVKKLLDNGEDVEQADKNGCTPLILAAYMGHPSIVQHLLNRSACVMNQGSVGVTPLYASCIFDHRIVTKIILNFQCDPNMRKKCDPNVKNARYTMDGIGDGKRKYKKKNCPLIEYKTPLGLAVCKDRCDQAEFLLQSGASVIDSCSDFIPYSTNMPSPFRDGKMEMIELLLSKGLSPNMESNCTTILQHAIESKNKKVLARLVKAGVKPEWIAREFSILIPAVRSTTSDFFPVVWLLQNKVDPNGSDSTGATALHVAVECKDCFNAFHLIKNGAFINAQDDKKMTPLHYAAQMNHKSLIEFLVFCGADTKITDFRRRAPFDCLRESLQGKREDDQALQLQRLLQEPNKYMNENKNQFEWIQEKFGTDNFVLLEGMCNQGKSRRAKSDVQREAQPLHVLSLSLSQLSSFLSALVTEDSNSDSDDGERNSAAMAALHDS